MAAEHQNGNYTGPDYQFLRERELVDLKVKETIREDAGMDLVRAGVQFDYDRRHPESLSLDQDELYYAVDNIVFGGPLPLPNGFDVRGEILAEVRSIYQQSGELVGLATIGVVEFVKMFVANVSIGRHERFIREKVEQAVRDGFMTFELEIDPWAAVPPPSEQGSAEAAPP